MNTNRFWIGTVIYGAVMIGIAIFNNVLLLGQHPLAYYYTLDGMKLTCALSVIEIPAILGIGKLYNNLFVKPLAKDLDDKRKEIKKL